jgi:hypothetical protein
MTNLVVHHVPAHRTGVVSGMNANIRNIGGAVAVGVAVVSSVVTSGLLPVAIALLLPGARRERARAGRVSPATVEVH